MFLILFWFRQGCLVAGKPQCTVPDRSWPVLAGLLLAFSAS